MDAVWYRCLGLLPFFTLAWICLSTLDAFRSAWRRIPASLVLGSSFLIALTALTAPLTHHLASSFWLGSAVCLFASLILGVWQRKSLRVEWNLSLDPWLGAVLVATLGITFVVGRIAWRFAFHDQMWIQAHPPLVASLLRENFPPGLMAFPGIPLKYHWGADLFGALISYCSGWPAYQAIDITMVFGIILWQWNIYLFCRLTGLSRAFSFLAILWIVLGAGWGFWLGPWLQSQGNPPIVWPGSQLVFGRHLNPATFYNFFMTPYSLGLGFFFGLLSLAWVGFQSRRIVAWAIFAWVLGTLAFIQISYFPTLLSAILAVFLIEALWRHKPWKQALLSAAIVAMISLGLAYSLGGFFTRSANYEPGLLLFTWPPGYLTNATIGGNIPIEWSQAALWYLASMGSVILLIVPCGIYLIKNAWKSWEPVIFLIAIFLLESALVPQFFRYKLSWDIIKWFISFQIAAQIFVVFAWSRLTRRFRPLGIIFLIFLLLDCFPTLRFATTLAFASRQEAGPHYQTWWNRVVISAPTPDIARLISLLKEGSSQKLVLGPYNLVQTLTRYSGQASAWYDQNTFMFGVKGGILQARRDLTDMSGKGPQPERWRQAGISWWIFPCGTSDTWPDQAKGELNHLMASAEMQKTIVKTSNYCWEVFHDSGAN